MEVYSVIMRPIDYSQKKDFKMGVRVKLILILTLCFLCTYSFISVKGPPETSHRTFLHQYKQIFSYHYCFVISILLITLPFKRVEWLTLLYSQKSAIIVSHSSSQDGGIVSVMENSLDKVLYFVFMVTRYLKWHSMALYLTVNIVCCSPNLCLAWLPKRPWC